MGLRLFCLILGALISIDPLWACIGVLQQFQVKNTSFSDEVFALVFTEYGYSLDTGGDKIFYNHQKNKWCVLPAVEATPNCEIDMGDLTVTATNDRKKKIGQFVEDKNNPKCFFVQSIGKKESVDKSTPYFKYCDRSDFGEATKHSDVAVEVWEKGVQKGEMTATTLLSSYDATTGKMEKKRVRGLAPSSPGKYELYGKSVVGSGCHMESSDYGPSKTTLGNSGATTEDLFAPRASGSGGK